jgi:hypothetical protein
MNMEQEVLGLALAIGRLTLALRQVEAERDALAAELANLKEETD